VIARGHPSRHSSFAQFAVQGDHDLGFLVDSLEANTIYTRVARKGTTVVTSPLDLFNDITDENVRGVWSPPPTSDDPSTAQASSAGIGIAWLNKNSWEKWSGFKGANRRAIISDVVRLDELGKEQCQPNATSNVLPKANALFSQTIYP